jgi:hypothetical protein
VGDVTNAGTASLDDPSGGNFSNIPSLTVVSPGTFTNTGIMDFGASSQQNGSIEQLSGDFVSTGTAEVMGGTLELLNGSSWDNGNTLTVDASTGPMNPTLDVESGASFDNDTNGSVINHGVVTSAGAITQGAGSTTLNPVEVTAGSIAFSGAGTPANYATQPNSSVTISGNIPAGVTLSINANSGTSNPAAAVVTASGSMTSAGTVALNDPSGGNFANFPALVIPGGDTFSSSGVMDFGQSTQQSGSIEQLTGAFISTGTAEVMGGTLELTNTSSWDNGGTFTVDTNTGAPRSM